MFTNSMLSRTAKASCIVTVAFALVKCRYRETQLGGGLSAKVRLGSF